MRECAFCGTDNQDHTLFCEWCGKRLSVKFEETLLSLSVSNETEEKNASNTNTSISTKKVCGIASLDLHAGGLYDGKVTRILPIGAFVELAPGKEGLVHISKLADYRIEKVEDVVNVGDMIWVKLIAFDEKGRFNLSRKDALREIRIKRQNGIVVPSTYRCCDASEQQDEIDEFKLQVGGLYDGKVTRILPIGAFVELAPGKEGLVHISKLADYRIEKVEDVVNVGDMILVKIVSIDENGHINLSRKDAMREFEIK